MLKITNFVFFLKKNQKFRKKRAKDQEKFNQI